VFENFINSNKEAKIEETDEEREEKGFEKLACLASNYTKGSTKNADLIRIRSDEVAEMLRIRLA
jgi:hypothetical protein